MNIRVLIVFIYILISACLLSAVSLDDANAQVADFPKEDVDFILNSIQPGDIMIQRNFDLKNIHTSAISGAVTGGRFTHTAIYLGKDKDGKHLIAESVGGGPRISTLTQYLGGRNDVMIIRPPYAGDQKAKALKYARDWAEKPASMKDYDIWGNNTTDGKFYCTELIYKALKQSGLNMPRPNNGKLSPSLFFLPPLGAFNHLRPGGALIGADTMKHIEGAQVIYGGRTNLPKHPFFVSYTHDIWEKLKKLGNTVLDKLIDAGNFISEKSSGVGKTIVQAGEKVIDFVCDAFSAIKGLFSKKTEQGISQNQNTPESSSLSGNPSELSRNIAQPDPVLKDTGKHPLSAGDIQRIRRQIDSKNSQLNVLIRENRLEEVKRISAEIQKLKQLIGVE